MKQILVIGGNSADPADVQELSDFCQGIQAAYPAAQTKMLHVDQLQFVIEPGIFKVLNSQNGQEVKAAELVVLRNKMRTYNTIAYCLSRYCATQNVQFFNDYSDYFPGTKIAQAVVFYEQHVPFIKTVYAMDRRVLTALIKSELTLPFVLKDALGAKGNSNYLVKSYDELEQHLQQELGTHFLAQEYCPNDCDYRILIAGDGRLVFKRQGAQGMHLNNTSTGASASLAANEVPQDIIGQSRQLAKAMHLQIVGVDVMPKRGTGEFYFIETNSQPQVFTGVFPDEKRELVARFLESKLS